MGFNCGTCSGKRHKFPGTYHENGSLPSMMLRVVGDSVWKPLVIGQQNPSKEGKHVACKKASDVGRWCPGQRCGRSVPCCGTDHRRLGGWSTDGEFGARRFWVFFVAINTWDKHPDVELIRCNPEPMPGFPEWLPPDYHACPWWGPKAGVQKLRPIETLG
jgi:hypothetical protein